MEGLEKTKFYARNAGEGPDFEFAIRWNHVKHGWAIFRRNAGGDICYRSEHRKPSEPRIFKSLDTAAEELIGNGVKKCTVVRSVK